MNQDDLFYPICYIEGQYQDRFSKKAQEEQDEEE
jgi:hypothetical protein